MFVTGKCAMTGKGSDIRMSRAVYDPAIREALTLGEVGRMKSVLKRARKVQAETGNLSAGIADLEAAIARLEKR